MMQKPLTPEQLDTYAELLDQKPPEHYPARHERLFTTAAGLMVAKNTLVIPEGPWRVTNHPNRVDTPPEELDPDTPTASFPPAWRKERWQHNGLTLDQHGWPVHPSALQLLADPRIGLPTGPGFFYRVGVNETVDAGLKRQHGQRPPEILLVLRKDKKEWATAGGFGDLTDANPTATALRELGEETQLWLNATGEVIVEKHLLSPHMTLHSWVENRVVLLHPEDPDILFDLEPRIEGDAVHEVLDIGWFTEEAVEQLTMYYDHGDYARAIFAAP